MALRRHQGRCSKHTEGVGVFFLNSCFLETDHVDLCLNFLLVTAWRDLHRRTFSIERADLRPPQSCSDNQWRNVFRSSAKQPKPLGSMTAQKKHSRTAPYNSTVHSTGAAGRSTPVDSAADPPKHKRYKARTTKTLCSDNKWRNAFRSSTKHS